MLADEGLRNPGKEAVFFKNSTILKDFLKKKSSVLLAGAMNFA